ncbi:hypothetical protein ABW21_db0206401 [Orbilia brochopaga]|nr:hypothetical protein ABW21_db0206401 [Drechslerella brochopaga]
MADYSAGPIGGAPPNQYHAPNASHAPAGAGSSMGGQLMSRDRPAYPGWLRVLPPVILVFTVGVLGMVAYVVHTTGEGRDSLGFNLFACAWGLIVTPYIILSMFNMPQIHYNWLILILAGFSCIWWLTAFAYIASDARKIFQVIDLIDSYSSLYSGSIIKRAASAMPGFITLDFAQMDELLAAAKAAGVHSKLKRAMSSSYSSDFYGSYSDLLSGVLWCVFTVVFAWSLFRSSSSTPAAVASHEPKIEQGFNPQMDPQPYSQQQSYPQTPVYPSVPIPGASPAVESSYAPVKPDAAIFSAPAPAPTPTIIPVDPRQQDEIFMTPPPPPSQVNTPAPGYVNPQFGAGHGPGGHLETQEMPDRGYTVSPLSEISEMPGSAPGPRVEMPGQH